MPATTKGCRSKKKNDCDRYQDSRTPGWQLRTELGSLVGHQHGSIKSPYKKEPQRPECEHQCDTEMDRQGLLQRKAKNEVGQKRRTTGSAPRAPLSLFSSASCLPVALLG